MTRLLERNSYRAPLALACVDGVTGAVVSDGLTATVWRRDDPDTRLTARRSPFSGLLGVESLPGMWKQTHMVGPPGVPTSWPAEPPTPVSALIIDTRARYLTTLIAVDVPAPEPFLVQLFSQPARPGASSCATVRGEVRDDGSGQALGWAYVTVVSGPDTYHAVADQLGRFLLHMPWPDALSVPTGSGLGGLTWQLTVEVQSEPSALVRSPGLGSEAPPELASITDQQAAEIIDGGPHPSLDVALTYLSPLVLELAAVPS
jgi:hypothetical protein